MKFDELKKGESIFIDANIFIYHFGGQSDECKEILIKCAKGDLKGYTLTSNNLIKRRQYQTTLRKYKRAQIGH
mgnify:CR=1 FL=1